MSMLARKKDITIKVPQKHDINERDVIKEIKAFLRDNNFFFVRIEGSGKLLTDEYGRKKLIKSEHAGTPDLLVFGYGRVYAMEVKSPKRNASLKSEQAEFLASLIERGHHAAVVFSQLGAEHFLAGTIPDSYLVYEDVEIPIYF